MTHPARYPVILLACFSFGLFNPGVVHSADSDTMHGKVINLIKASIYTYVEVDTGTEKVWAAAPNVALAIGDSVTFVTDMPMANYHSKSLERSFPVVYFVGGFISDSAASTIKPKAAASPHGQKKQESVAKPVEGINKADGGNTIAEIHTHKQKLKGKTIRVRGQVTKFTADVMGKNWIHIRDSSTLDDLTVTTNGTAAINDVVILEGKLALDKDFNYGYFYSVLLQDASLTKE